MEICEMASCENGKFFMAGSPDGEILVFNSETCEQFGPYKTEFQSGGQRMCISSDGELFAAGKYRGNTTIFET